MAKPNAKTLQERMGFTDLDLKTPGHDAIMLWLDHEIDLSLAGWLRLPVLSWEAWLAEELKGWPNTLSVTIADLPRDRTEAPRLTVVKKQWEAVVRNRNGFEVGFIDMWVNYTSPSLGQTIGDGKWHLWSGRDHSIGFEVKTAIHSLGELFRQLALYREAVERIFVVCPDARFADKIREQGFGFIQCPAGKANGKPSDDGWLFGRSTEI